MNRKCCFAGHSNSYLSDETENRLKELIEKLIVEDKVTEFWVGNYGNFDSLCAGTVRILKDKYPEIELILVIPYLTNDINEYKELYYKNYDTILVADIPEHTPKRFWITKCNEYMVDKSDFIICYIRHRWGGAAVTLEYAKRKKHIKIHNL